MHTASLGTIGHEGNQTRFPVSGMWITLLMLLLPAFKFNNDLLKAQAPVVFHITATRWQRSFKSGSGLRRIHVYF